MRNRRGRITFIEALGGCVPRSISIPVLLPLPDAANLLPWRPMTTTLEVITANLFAMELPELLELEKLVVDEIARRASQNTVADAAVAGEEAVADAMEKSKFPA
jgi:hypothetical protein